MFVKQLFWPLTMLNEFARGSDRKFTQKILLIFLYHFQYTCYLPPQEKTLGKKASKLEASLQAG